MRTRIVLLFYHPKDPKNVEDIAKIASSTGAELLVVPRPGGPRLEPQGYKLVSLEEAVKELSGCFKVLLETYGFQYLDEAKVDCGDCVALILGAEDYGVPRHIADMLEPHVVARIPMRVEGMSYNVASSATMGLYEIVSRCSGRLEPPEVYTS